MGVIVKIQFLGIVRVDGDSLAPGFLMDGEALNGFLLGYYHCPSDAGKDDLAVLVGPVQAVGGLLAALGVHKGAVRVSDFELYPLQRGLIPAGQFVDDELAPQAGCGTQW